MSSLFLRNREEDKKCQEKEERTRKEDKKRRNIVSFIGLFCKRDL